MPQWDCSNYSAIVVGIGVWETLFLSDRRLFEPRAQALLSSLTQLQPRAKLIVRLATPAACLPETCETTRFQSSLLTNHQYNDDIANEFNPSLRAVAARFGATVVDAWGPFASYPELTAMIRQRRSHTRGDHTPEAFMLHPQCDEESRQNCSLRNNSELSLALSAQLKHVLCLADRR
jgi:hypothetical protein